MSPSNAFGFEDAPHLAASDNDPSSPSGLRERVQRPMGCLTLISGSELAASATDQPPGRITRHQSDDPGAFGLGKTRLAPSARQIAEAVDPFSIEAMETFAHSLRVATQSLQHHLALSCTATSISGAIRPVLGIFVTLSPVTIRAAAVFSRSLRISDAVGPVLQRSPWCEVHPSCGRSSERALSSLRERAGCWLACVLFAPQLYSCGARACSNLGMFSAPFPIGGIPRAYLYRF